MKKVYLALSTILLIPHIILFNLSSKKIGITYEIERWLYFKGIKLGVQTGFLHLMTFYPEFRNLFYYRIGPYSGLLNFLCPKMNTLFIITKSIGFGLYIQHGFATIISAKSIGNDCKINQQVTIGYQGFDSPVLNDNVTVTAGAKIIGNVTIGSNTIVGANAVVIKDVPNNCTVVGIPAYIVKRDGIKVQQDLVKKDGIKVRQDLV
jgi:serine O-acetyltransferase